MALALNSRLSAPPGGVPDPIPQQIRIGVSGTGPTAQRTLIPESASAQLFLDDQSMHGAMHRILSVVDLAAQEQGVAPPDIRSLSLSMTQDAYHRNVMHDVLSGADMVGKLSSQRSDAGRVKIAAQAAEETAAFAASTIASTANQAMSLGPDVSNALMSAWNPAPHTRNDNDMAMAVRAIRHESEHMVDTAALDTASAHNLREVTAEVASIPVPELTRTAQLLGITISPAALQQASQTLPYGNLVSAAADALQAGGIDAASDQALTMLRGQSRTVNDRLVSAIAQHQQMSSSAAQKTLDGMLQQATTGHIH